MEPMEGSQKEDRLAVVSRLLLRTIQRSLIREGLRVEDVHGPLRGVIGRLIRKGARARLVLSVDLIGQAVSVEVDAADVRAY